MQNKTVSQQIYTEYIRPVENNRFELHNSITKTWVNTDNNR